MFYLIGLVFLILKIAVQASIYSTIILFAFFIVAKTTHLSFPKKLMKHKFISWFITGFIISILFIVYAFSYWGNRGLGDYARIPIGNDYEVGNIDGASTYFEGADNPGRQAFLNRFAIYEDKLCAEFYGFNADDCKDCVIILDIYSGQTKEFHSTKEYEAYASVLHLPLKKDFKDFFANYWDYWGGRVFFLP